MRGHDRGHARRDGRPERDELHGSEAVGRVLDERQLEVRVGAGIAVPGEVLAAGGNALRPAAPG